MLCTRTWMVTIGLIAVVHAPAMALEFTGIDVGTWLKLSDPAGEDVRYLEAIQGDNALFWRTGSSQGRLATYSYTGGAVTLGSPVTPSGLSSGDHATILNRGGGSLEGYFQPVPQPSMGFQKHAFSDDGGLTWSDEANVIYPFPTPPGIGDSGTTGGGGIIEVGSQRRIYAQNNFGDIVMFTTSAGAAGPLTNAGRLITKGASGTAPSGASYSFQNQSPSGDALELPTGDVLYFYTDGEGAEGTQGAVGVLLLSSSGLSFTDVRDNFVNVGDPGLVAAGMTSLDEMTVNNISVTGNQLSFLLFLAGKHGGSDRDIFYAPVTIEFDSTIPEPASLSLLALAGLAVLRRRNRRQTGANV